jgi:hypothetical protein
LFLQRSNLPAQSIAPPEIFLKRNFKINFRFSPAKACVPPAAGV